MQSKQSLEFDKRCLSDLGLTMPRCTQKYVAAVSFLSHVYETSAYFFHVEAARYGVDWLYTGLEKQRIRYANGKWQESQRPNTGMKADAAGVSAGGEDCSTRGAAYA